MKIASLFLQFAGLALLFHGTQGFLGLKANIPFGTTLSATTTKLSAGFATLVASVVKIQEQANLLKLPLTQGSVADLATIKTTFTIFQNTYVALGASFLNATGPAGIVINNLADGVKYIDTLLPAFGSAMFNMETLTSIKLLNAFPSSASQTNLQQSFFNIFTSVLTLADKASVTASDINAILSVDDLKIIQDFYDFYLGTVATVNVQLTIILTQYTALVFAQNTLLRGVSTFSGEMLAWNTKLVGTVTKIAPSITAALNAELKAEQTVIAAVVAKLITYMESDEAVVIPGAISALENFGKKYRNSIRKALAAVNTASVSFTDFGQMVADGSVGTEVSAVQDILSKLAPRIFSSSNVLAMKCATTMQADFVKEMFNTKTDIFRCSNDLLNYFPQSNDFVALQMGVLKAFAAWRLGSVSICTKYLTATSSETTAASAFGNCLSKTSGVLNNNYAEIDVLINNMSNQIIDDLAIVTADFGTCFEAQLGIHSDVTTQMMVTFDKCSRYTAPKPIA